MKSTTKARISIAAVIAFLIAFACALVFAVPASKAEASDLQKATLTYSDAAQTVVDGIDENADGFDSERDYEIVIPANVVKIDMAAFAGQKHLVKLSFENGAAIREIADFAFGDTGLTQVVLPDGLKKIGDAAFGDNKTLAKVSLPNSLESVGTRAFGNAPALTTVSVSDNEQTVYGEAAFDVSAYLIANGRASYEKLKTVPSLASFTDGLTYEVEIEYDFRGGVIGSVKRLYGKAFTVVLQDGIWGVDDGATLGTAEMGDVQWYGKADGTGGVLTVADVTAMLCDKSFDGEKITLYAFDSDGKKVFVARKDLAYDGKTYSMTELNSLLYATSDKITPNMTVSIESYTTADGENVDPAAEAFPTVVGNAGKYGMKVVDGGTGYTFDINIARKTVDLGDYTNNLSWKLVNVGGTGVVSELLDSSGVTLYVYTFTDGGAEYPSRTVLSDSALAELGLDERYETRFVRYSVVRYRGENVYVTVGITGGMAGVAYTIEYNGGNSANGIGAYKASATVTATENYTLALAGSPVDGAARGISVNVAADGRSASIDKVWYVVDEGNWAVDGDGGDYSIADRVYGDTLAVMPPRIMYGDVHEVDYGAVLDPVTLTLIRNGDTIIGNETFTRARFAYYINNAMPAGDYELRITAREVTTEEYDESDTTHSDPHYIWHSGFTESVRFTVQRKAIPTVVTDSIDRAINGKKFTYVWDGSSHYYDQASADDVRNALDSAAAFDRADTVWELEQYDDLFGGFDITFNLSRMQNDKYYTADAMPVALADPDKYTVFYKVCAPNYYDSTYGLSGDANRTDLYFEVVNVKTVDVPVLRDKTYNGSSLTADISDTLLYTVTSNVGGVNVGEYDVTLTLREPDYYMWTGQTIADKTATFDVKFGIVAANNGWAVEPSIAFWVAGSYDKTENAVTGAARYGTVVIVITDVDDNVLYDSSKGINKLDGAKAGVYRLSATVASTVNYDALTYSAFVQVFEKPGLPWWAILSIVLGALAIAALILLILYKKGVFRLLTDKIVLAIRTKATVDATIAAVRASKVAAASQASRAQAEARDRAEERAQARKLAAEAEEKKSAFEKAAELEAKAQAEVERADKIKAKAEVMQARAVAIKESAAAAETETVATDTEQPSDAEVAEAPKAPKPSKKSAGKKKPADQAETPADRASTESETSDIPTEQ